ncbi:hypothetical protein LMH87_000855 [Akanthomyces muscarius]|uniref:ABC transporter domain-containing protein n=1 Tax=Akanthomyces muscarius TaxID=2231603 RepID=A0A9W8QG83_AKAMU|nr:hypothetical protein LMH87_000855 [Akanthomyces muscarius]KAJ4155619.1 hypothetical protein LMH87_000855 [Akanthomyces muscarius]
MVPQDALLFQGTVRMNLDPSNTIPDSDLNEFLSMCASLNAMKSQAENDSLQSDLMLDTPVSPGGNNFSHGQRQVLSLCRAMVRKNKLTLLDEATSSVDMGTDSAIQGILRAQLSGGQHGLITVAHRLKTVLDYDKVVVMGFGKVLEMGSPTELLDSKCKFYDMMEHSGGAE